MTFTLRLASSLGAATLAIAITAVVLAAPARASAAPLDTVDVGTPGHLTIDVEPAVFDPVLDPGESDEWLLTLRSDAPTPGALSYTFASSGSLADSPLGAWVQLDECPTPWSGSRGATSCAELASHIAAAPFANIDAVITRQLGSIEPGDQRHLRIRVSMPSAMPSEMQGGEADFTLTVHGMGDTATVTTNPAGSIAMTGADIVQPLIASIALVLAGIVVSFIVPLARREGVRQ